MGGEVIVPDLKSLNETEFLDYDQVWGRFVELMDWLAQRYVGAMNVIHYSHDRYNYESLEMALHDTDVRRLMAFGVAGLSIVADSLSAIKHAQVRPKWNSAGVAESYEIIGDFPKYGNDDSRVDDIAVQIVEEFSQALKRYKTYRNAEHTLSVLTITSNVMYGKLTGATPDGRKSGVPFAPGANPMPGSETKGALAALNSVAKLPYSACMDGISNTFSIVPDSLGKDSVSRESNLMQILSGYFAAQGGHHLNINVLTPELLTDAKLHPENYPQLTIRVSGYAVLFAKLSPEQQDEVISRTFHRHV
jgi:formate C-acetyltransferase